MPYVISIVLQTLRDNIVEVLNARFKQVPQALIKRIQAIKDATLLSQLLREAALVDSPKSFIKVLGGGKTNNFVTQDEPEKKVPDVNTIERQSALQTGRNYIVEVLKARFKRVSQALTKQIQAIEDETLLSQLHKEAVFADSLKSFKQVLENSQS